MGLGDGECKCRVTPKEQDVTLHKALYRNYIVHFLPCYPMGSGEMKKKRQGISLFKTTPCL